MLEHLSPTPTVSLYNFVRLDCFPSPPLGSRRYAYMAKTYCACVLSRTFCAERNTDGLVGLECDSCFDTIIFICNASSSRAKAFQLLDQCVLRHYQPKPITLIHIFSFKASILDDSLLIFSAPFQPQHQCFNTYQNKTPHYSIMHQYIFTHSQDCLITKKILLPYL